MWYYKDLVYKKIYIYLFMKTYFNNIVSTHITFDSLKNVL